MNIQFPRNANPVINLNKSDRTSIRYTATVLDKAATLLSRPDLAALCSGVLAFLEAYEPKPEEQKTLPLDKPEDKEAPF